MIYRPTIRLAGTMIATGFGIGAAAAQETGFDGQDLIAVSDGAMVASGYIDGVLGPRQPDLVSVLGREDGGWRRSDVATSNSVATWPNILAVTADGRHALVTEPFAQPSHAAEAFSEIERGTRISVLDISDRSAPVVVQEVEAPGAPGGIDVHPDGAVVAVTLPFSGEIALYPFAAGHLGEPSLHSIGFEGLEGTFLPEIKWHPSGAFAAVTMGAAGQVGFYRYDGTDLAPWGPAMQTAPLPGKGTWTADGAYFIVTTITAAGDMAQIGYGQNSSLFAVFAFDDDEEPDTLPRRSDDQAVAYESPAVQHTRIAHVPNGMGYVENFAVSPDGAWVVGLNMAASWLPLDHPGQTPFSELTLFALDGETGILSPRGVTRMDGVVLPQGITFDAASETLAVTSFQHDDRDGGSIAFWRLEDDNLVATGETIDMPRGIHFLATLPPVR